MESQITRREFITAGSIEIATEGGQAGSSKMPAYRAMPKGKGPFPTLIVVHEYIQDVCRRLAITGFCWGGTATWLYSHHNPKVKAGVAWYGRHAAAGPKSPLDIGKDLKVPVLGLYGGKDAGIPLEDVEKMRVELAKDKSGSELVVYPDAGHAFHADYRPSYDEKSAKDGWKRMLAWFEKV